MQGNRPFHDRRRGLVIPANLSRWHPDFGKTAAEHAEAKKLRAAGGVPFIPKVELRARRERLL